MIIENGKRDSTIINFQFFIINSHRVLAFGTFDDLHPGHLAYLREAASYGELHVIVARDANVERIKKRAPLQNEAARMEAIRKAFPDARVMLGSDADFLGPVRAIRPDLIVLGYDQALPPGATEELLGCPIHRAAAYRPDIYKSSIRRGRV